MTAAGAGQRTGVFRVHWLPGTDTLLGICQCGAEQRSEDPVELWRRLLAHPDGHRPPDPGTPPPPDGTTRPPDAAAAP